MSKYITLPKYLLATYDAALRQTYMANFTKNENASTVIKKKKKKVKYKYSLFPY